MTSISLTTNTTVQLLPQRALFWPAQRAVVIADAHIGRPLPHHQHAATLLQSLLGRLSHIIKTTAATQCIVLGDLFHMRKHYLPEAVEPFVQWRQQHADLDMLLVRGNHERAMGDPPARCGLRCINPGFVLDDVTLLHEPRQQPGFAMAAHLHPNMLVPGPRTAMVAVACFIWHPNYLVLPAFEDAVPGRVVARHPAERQAYILQDEVVLCDA
jgi:DNA ligase-associated metallophosphoesterase